MLAGAVSIAADNKTSIAFLFFLIALFLLFFISLIPQPSIQTYKQPQQKFLHNFFRTVCFPRIPHSFLCAYPWTFHFSRAAWISKIRKWSDHSILNIWQSETGPWSGNRYQKSPWHWKTRSDAIPCGSQRSQWRGRGQIILCVCNILLDKTNFTSLFTLWN